MLAKVRHTLAQHISKLPAMLLAKTGISPNALTVFGFMMTLAVAWVLSTGRFFLGGFLVLLSGAFDFLDGALGACHGAQHQIRCLPRLNPRPFLRCSVIFRPISLLRKPGFISSDSADRRCSDGVAGDQLYQGEG